MLTDAAALRPFLIGSEHLMRARVVEVDDHHGIVVVTRERHDRLDVLGGRERCFEDDGLEIGRAHVRTPVINAHLVCRLMLEKKHMTNSNTQRMTKLYATAPNYAT